MGTESHVSRSDFLSQVKIGKNKNIQNQLLLWNRFGDVCDPVKKADGEMRLENATVANKSHDKSAVQI